MVGHAPVGHERRVKEERTAQKELRLGPEGEALALAAGQRDVDARAVAEAVEDAVDFLACQRHAGAQLDVAELEPPAEADIVGIAGIQSVVRPNKGYWDAGYRDQQVGEREREVAELQVAGHAEG